MESTQNEKEKDACLETITDRRVGTNVNENAQTETDRSTQMLPVS